MEFRIISEDEIGLIWGIDRTEYVEANYIYRDGKLEEQPVDRTFHGWPPNEDAIYGPILRDCHRRGGFFLGGFADNALKAIVVVDPQRIGRNRDSVQLKFLHIDRSLRKTGLGRILFEKAVEQARQWHAKRLYISSCENKNTVEFYRHMGCRITDDVDKKLYALEPNDIHMELML